MVRLDLLVSHSHMILTVHSGKSWDKPTSSIIDGGWNYFLCTQFRFSAMTHVLQSADIFPLVFFCLFCKQVTSFCEFRQSRLVFCLYLWLKHLRPRQCLGLSCTPLSLFLSLSLSSNMFTATKRFSCHTLHDICATTRVCMRSRLLNYRRSLRSRIKSKLQQFITPNHTRVVYCTKAC